MVITDRVKNKKFTNYMDVKLYTAKIEYEAIAFINYFFGERFGKLYRADAPDIQDENDEWGIEVVKVVSENDGRLEGETARYLRAIKENNETEQQKYAQKIERDGGTVIGDMVMMAVRSDADEKGVFQNSIQRKLDKLPQYKNKGFKLMGLYMFYESPITFGTPHDRQEWLVAAQDNYVDKYDIAIVVYQDDVSWRISFYNFEFGEFSDQKISDDIVNYIGKLGRMTAEGEVKQDDPEWL